MYWVVSSQRLTSPKASLLHYPYPPNHIEEFEKLVSPLTLDDLCTYQRVTDRCRSLVAVHQVISVTNYTGDSREYLKKLIECMGGHWTPGFSNVNTHVVAAT